MTNYEVLKQNLNYICEKYKTPLSVISPSRCYICPYCERGCPTTPCIDNVMKFLKKKATEESIAKINNMLTRYEERIKRERNFAKEYHGEFASDD